MSRSSPPAVSRPVRRNRGRWEAVPVGVRLTFTEAANIIGIRRTTLINAYTGLKARRKLPEGFHVIREGVHGQFLIRYPQDK